MGTRTDRYSGLLNPERLGKTEAMVVGCGATGRQVALQLAAMGIGKLHLVDHDKVDEVNLGTQGWWESDIGGLKVNILNSDIYELNRKTEVRTYPNKFAVDTPIIPITFLCVDTMEARRTIWGRWVAQLPDTGPWLWVDPRMSAETCRVVTRSHLSDNTASYVDTLVSDAEAFTGTCTTQSTIYCANIAAGLSVAQFARWFRGIKPIPDFTYDLFANLVLANSVGEEAARE